LAEGDPTAAWKGGIIAAPMPDLSIFPMPLTMWVEAVELAFSSSGGAPNR